MLFKEKVGRWGQSLGVQEVGRGQRRERGREEGGGKEEEGKRGEEEGGRENEGNGGGREEEGESWGRVFLMVCRDVFP